MCHVNNVDFPLQHADRSFMELVVGRYVSVRMISLVTTLLESAHVLLAGRVSHLPSHTVFCSIGVYFLTSVCFAEKLQGQVKERPKHTDILEFAKICSLFDLELESF